GLIDGRGHAVDVMLPAARLWLDADATRLPQVIGNLLNNAAKYTPAGGKISVTAQAAGGVAELRVRDTGAGIPPESLPGIFEPFAQGDRTLTRAEGGLGIGLTLARMLVELHGGTLSAASEGAGRGSEFVVRLPLGTPAVAEAEPAAAAAPAAPGRRVVIVEDDADTRDVLQVF